MSNLSKEIIEQRLKDRPLAIIGDYINNRIHTKFKCLIEGCGHEWDSRPDNILSGKGCPKCSGKMSLTKDIVNQRLSSRSLILIGEYFNKETKTLFKCLKKDCGHEWDAKPGNILHNSSGCPKCADTTLSKELVNQRLNTRQIQLIGEYKSNKTKTLFRCLVEGCNHEWNASPGSILNIGTGCPRCSNSIPLSKGVVNDRLKDRLILLEGEYTTNKIKTNFKCVKCNYRWTTTVDSILHVGSGCPKCAKYGFDPSKPAILYYLKIAHRVGDFYKIGITNRRVEDRFQKRELHMIDIMFEKKYNNGVDAYNEEQRILKEYSEYRYNGNEILSSGNSEIFVKNILEI